MGPDMPSVDAHMPLANNERCSTRSVLLGMPAGRVPFTKPRVLERLVLLPDMLTCMQHSADAALVPCGLRR